MKKAFLAALCALMLAGCGEAADSSSSKKTTEAPASSAAESTADSTTDSTSETDSSQAGEEFSYTDIKQDPYELEKAVQDSDNMNMMIDDSETFDKADDLRNSVWAKYLSEKAGVPKDSLTPKPADGVEELGCTAHLSFYSLAYNYNGKGYTLQTTVRKFDSIDKMLEEYTSPDGFSMASQSTQIEDGVIVDKFSGYENGYMLAGLSAEGLEWQLFAADKDTTLDEMKAFAKALSF